MPTNITSKRPEISPRISTPRINTTIPRQPAAPVTQAAPRTRVIPQSVRARVAPATTTRGTARTPGGGRNTSASLRPEIVDVIPQSINMPPSRSLPAPAPALTPAVSQPRSANLLPEIEPVINIPRAVQNIVTNNETLINTSPTTPLPTAPVLPPSSTPLPASSGSSGGSGSGSTGSSGSGSGGMPSGSVPNGSNPLPGLPPTVTVDDSVFVKVPARLPSYPFLSENDLLEMLALSAYDLNAPMTSTFFDSHYDPFGDNDMAQAIKTQQSVCAGKFQALIKESLEASGAAASGTPKKPAITKLQGLDCGIMPCDYAMCNGGLGATPAKGPKIAPPPGKAQIEAANRDAVKNAEKYGITGPIAKYFRTPEQWYDWWKFYRLKNNVSHSNYVHTKEDAICMALLHYLIANKRWADVIGTFGPNVNFAANRAEPFSESDLRGIFAAGNKLLGERMFIKVCINMRISNILIFQKQRGECPMQIALTECTVGLTRRQALLGQARTIAIAALIATGAYYLGAAAAASTANGATAAAGAQAAGTAAAAGASTGTAAAVGTSAATTTAGSIAATVAKVAPIAQKVLYGAQTVRALKNGQLPPMPTSIGSPSLVSMAMKVGTTALAAKLGNDALNDLGDAEKQMLEQSMQNEMQAAVQAVPMEQRYEMSTNETMPEPLVEIQQEEIAKQDKEIKGKEKLASWILPALGFGYFLMS